LLSIRNGRRICGTGSGPGPRAAAR
jgi:hypothetical protein